MMRTRNKFIFLVAVIALAAGAYLLYNKRDAQAPLPPAEITYNDSTDHVKSDTIPNSLLIKVPFTPQAPTANWDELHNEACEEASAIMANAYFNSISSLPADKVETEITKLTEWQDKNQGYHLDQTSAETAKMIEAVYGLKAEVAAMDQKTIKQALKDNKLVLISFNGRLLKNPHYKQPGPIHHMLVLTGWNGDTFITNDSGTKFGLNYQYDYNTLYSAAADWNHSIESVDEAKKLMIIVSK